MKPLPQKHRYAYMIIAIIAFVISAPLLILYASGYRLDKTFSFATTGGVHISAPLSGTEIYLNNELVRTTSIFQKSIFVQNLKPGTYSVSVKKSGYQEWSKTLMVFPETVTDAYSFTLPAELVTKEIPAKIGASGSSGASTTVETKLIDNPDYVDVVALFKVPKKVVPTEKVATTTKVATSTDIAKEFRKLLVEKVDGNLRITWTGDIESKPSYFCQNNDCKDEIYIKPSSTLKNFDFFPGRGDLIIMSQVGGIFVSEIDDRSPQNVQKLFDGPNVDFRIKDGDKIFLKKDSVYYSVSL
jgi:hypothetical protein